MAKYKIIGERGSFITTKAEARQIKKYEIGGWTNETGEIKKIVKLPDKKPKKRTTSPFGIKMPKVRMPKFRL